MNTPATLVPPSARFESPALNSPNAHSQNEGMERTSETVASVPASRSTSIGRVAGIAFGAGTQLLFLYTVVHLFQFLRDGETSFGKNWLSAYPEGTIGFLSNTLLALFFAWPHSLLLMPAVQKRIKSSIPAGLIGCIHCVGTCVSLLLLFMLWHKTSGGLWNFSGPAATIMQIGFYGSWIALFYSLYWTGFGYQTGLTQWWYWMRKTPAPRRAFVESGPYRWLRHPVYLSFLGLIWFTPNMTWDHLLLTGIWTVYIFVGSYFKDRRLLFYLGDTYREYASRIPGYPLIGFGPMGRWKLDS